ncbi:hypothetical protein PR048_021905 [Dryococelus australis]|uniref:Uncharacterized protein n=1 Tax=Dryococelus australis TaxID=614101 RepID=A0ABQ9GZK7_9NEOP|nr:hypothetical protein PR048_021905 [Dryococelus australis]
MSLARPVRTGEEDRELLYDSGGLPSDRRRAEGEVTSGREVCDCEYQAVKGAAGRLDYWIIYTSIPHELRYVPQASHGLTHPVRSPEESVHGSQLVDERQGHAEVVHRRPGRLGEVSGVRERVGVVEVLHPAREASHLPARIHAGEKLPFSCSRVETRALTHAHARTLVDVLFIPNRPRAGLTCPPRRRKASAATRCGSTAEPSRFGATDNAATRSAPSGHRRNRRQSTFRAFPPLHPHSPVIQPSHLIFRAGPCTYQRWTRHDGNTASLGRRSDESLGVRVSVDRNAPSLLDLGRELPTGVHPTLKMDSQTPIRVRTCAMSRTEGRPSEGELLGWDFAPRTTRCLVFGEPILREECYWLRILERFRFYTHLRCPGPQRTSSLSNTRRCAVRGMRFVCIATNDLTSDRGGNKVSSRFTEERTTTTASRSQTENGFNHVKGAATPRRFVAVYLSTLCSDLSTLSGAEVRRYVTNCTLVLRRNERVGETGDPEKTHQPTASSVTIPTCENPVNPLHRPAIGDKYLKQRADIGQHHAGRGVFLIKPSPREDNKDGYYHNLTCSTTISYIHNDTKHTPRLRVEGRSGDAAMKYQPERTTA